MRRFALSLPVLCSLLIAQPAKALSRDQVEATLLAAVTQVSNQYVDPLDTRSLAVHGLRALAELPDAAARKPAIEQAVIAQDQAQGVAPQTRILADQILRFADGPPREAALAAALRGMMGSLDSYSRLAAPAELAPPPASVGLELSIKNGQLTVARPLPGSPAEQAGILAGDVIFSIDGRQTAGLPLSEAVALLRGAPGSSPALLLQRPGAARDIMLQPVRGPVQAPASVRWDLQGSVALIRVANFDSKTGGQLRAALDAARASTPLTGLVLDLRGNSGGLLDAAEQVAGMVLPDGLEIGSLRGRTPDNERVLHGRNSRLPHDVAVVTLVDARTGAGAEIVAAALQDHGRALLIGQKTAGAGTIQTVLPLPEGQGALLLTTARVLRFNGESLAPAGVTPDVLLDTESGKFSIRSELAADFNTVLIKKWQSALPAAPAGTDLALMAALTALTFADER